MTSNNAALLAAHNNAVWCNTVCDTHRAAGTFADGFWINRGDSPRFYPNIVTTNPADQAAQLAAIRGLAETKQSSGWGVKDSFHALDLAPLGFEPAFDAEWICRAAELPPPDSDIAGVRWAVVRTAPELALWEAAWNGTADLPPAETERIFLPELLDDSEVALIAAYRNERIVAGAIANRTGAVVGISNTFAPGEESQLFLGGCIAGAMRGFPGLPLVGYERDDDLAAALAHGFETVGVLRVWLKN